MILDLGCGEEQYGDVRADLTRSLTTNIICDAHHLPFRANVFDIVHSKNLFEHLSNPMLSLKEQKRVLKLEGKIILITDNASYWRFHYLSKSAHIKYRGRSRNDLHYALFLPLHIENFFAQVGLKTLTINFVGQTSYRITGAINFVLRRLPILQHISYGRFKAVGVKTKDDFFVI